MKLLPLLLEFQKEGITSTTPELRELFQYSSQIALKYLNGKYQSDRIRFLNLGYSFTDIAIDSIAPLFVIHKTANVLGIIKSFQDWITPITNEEQAEYFLHKIVVSRVEQELIRIYKEADPFFNKIHDALEFIIKKNCYCKKTIYGTVYMFEDCESASLKTIAPYNFENLNFSLFRGKLETVIKNLFRELKNEMGFATAIPLNLFVKRIKHFHLSDDYLNLITVQENHEERLDSNKIIEDSMTVTFSKLNLSYNHKLNSDEKAAFKSALLEIGRDLTNGGLSIGLFEYLNNHMVGLSSKEFYKKYHSILDYLFRILKKEIASRIEFSNTN